MATYSLGFFHTLLSQKPIGLPDEIYEQGMGQYDKLADAKANAEEIERAMIDYGKKTWAYRQAGEEFKEKFGKKKEKELFMTFLPEEAREKWKDFEAQGGSIHNFREGKKFEDFFTTQEDLAINEAQVEAQKVMYDYLNGVSSDEKQDEFRELLEKYQDEQKEIEKKIEELRSMIPEEGEKWDEEMAQEVLFFEQGLADIEERPTVEKVQGKIDWYRGQMDAGNK